MNLFIYLIICTIWCGTHNTVGLYLSLFLQITHPAQDSEASHTTGIYVLYSFRTVVWVLLRLTRTI